VTPAAAIDVRGLHMAYGEVEAVRGGEARVLGGPAGRAPLPLDAPGALIASSG
jgi:hypothetical protein